MTAPTDLAPDLLARLEQVIWTVAEGLDSGLARRPGELSRAVCELSEGYNAGQPPPPSPIRRLARLVFFTVADLPKVAFPLAELEARQQLPGGPLQVLDLGAGYGAQTLGLLALLETLERRDPVHVTAVDRDGEALATLAQVVHLAGQEGVLSAPVELTQQRRDLGRGAAPDGAYHLILAGSVLTELPPGARLPLVRRLLGRLLPGGQLVVIEPALRDVARQLHALRDSLVAGADATVFAPCTHQGACPMLRGERDWCMERRTWLAPPRLRQLAQATGLRRKGLAWSYLTLNRHGANIGALRPGAARVVSKPLKSKGKLEQYLCGEAGLLQAARLKRHRSADNAAMDQLQRGSLAWLTGAPPCRGSRQPVERETGVQLEDPAARARYLVST